MKLTYEDLQAATHLLLADQSAKVLARDYARDENDNVDPRRYLTMKEAIENQQFAICVVVMAGVVATGFGLMNGVIKIVKAVKKH